MNKEEVVSQLMNNCRNWHLDYPNVASIVEAGHDYVNTQVNEIEKVADFLDRLPDMISKEVIQKVIIDAMIYKIYYSSEVATDRFAVEDLVELINMHLPDRNM